MYEVIDVIKKLIGKIKSLFSKKRGPVYSYNIEVITRDKPSVTFQVSSDHPYNFYFDKGSTASSSVFPKKKKKMKRRTSGKKNDIQ